MGDSSFTTPGSSTIASRLPDLFTDSASTGASSLTRRSSRSSGSDRKCRMPPARPKMMQESVAVWHVMEWKDDASGDCTMMYETASCDGNADTLLRSTEFVPSSPSLSSSSASVVAPMWVDDELLEVDPCVRHVWWSGPVSLNSSADEDVLRAGRSGRVTLGSMGGCSPSSARNESDLFAIATGKPPRSTSARNSRRAPRDECRLCGLSWARVLGLDTRPASSTV
mmetsp:Transcript_10737/g.34041  ORF Transcript_10737/g.34041 Transcript_10737/m.34041 type:complete len:225 (-) Transcript_10737:1774-2448(-)